MAHGKNCRMAARNRYILSQTYVRIPDFFGNDVYIALCSYSTKEDLALEINKNIRERGTLIPESIRIVIPVEIIDPWNLRRREVIEKGFLNYGDGPFAKIIDALKDYEKRNSGRDLVSDQIVPGNQDSYITELQRLKDALKRKSEGKSTSEETSEWLKDWAEAEENGC